MKTINICKNLRRYFAVQLGEILPFCLIHMKLFKNGTGKADLTIVSRINQLYLVSLVFIRGFSWLPSWLAITGTNSFLLLEQLSLV